MSTAENTAYGVLGGVVGAGCMSALRMAAHRAGLIDKMVPQVVEEWLAHRSGAEPPGGRTGHQVADQLLHIGYGMAWGGAYGALAGSDGRRPSLWRGPAFGAIVWAIGAAGLFPALGIARPPWRAERSENAVNIAAHLVYGLAVQLLTDQLSEQDRGPTTDAERHATRVG